jgi:hypothetical protein
VRDEVSNGFNRVNMRAKERRRGEKIKINKEGGGAWKFFDQKKVEKEQNGNCAVANFVRK